jgi:hypothetical protein
MFKKKFLFAVTLMAPWLSLVERTTDNREVPSSNLGGAIFLIFVVSNRTVHLTKNQNHDNL